MADFSAEVPQVSGGDMRVMPSSNMATANALGNAASTGGNVFNDLFTGRQEQRKLSQQKQIGAALADQEQRLSAIADAVDQGQMSSATGRMHARAVMTQAVANNPIIADQLQESYNKFFSTAGKTVGEGTEQEKLRTSLVSQAAKDGFVSPTMTLQEQDQGVAAWQQTQHAMAAYGLAKQQYDLESARIGVTNANLTTQQKRQELVTGAINQQDAKLRLAKNTLEFQADNALSAGVDSYSFKFNNIAKDLAKRVQSGELDAGQASVQLDQTIAQLQSEITQTYGGFGKQNVEATIAPLQKMAEVYKDQFTGKTDLAVANNKLASAMAATKLNMVSDEDTRKVIASSEFFGNNLALIPHIDKTFAKIFAISADGSTKPPDLIPSDDTGKKNVNNYLGGIQAGIARINGGQFTIGSKYSDELVTQVNSALKSVKAYSGSTETASDYNNLINFFANPTVGKFMVDSGAIDKQNSSKAYEVVEREYEQQAIIAMQKEYYSAVSPPQAQNNSAAASRQAQEAGNFGPPASKYPNLVTPTYTTNGGFKFVPVQIDAKQDPTNYERAKKAASDLNDRVSPLMQRLIQVSAHLSGTTNYDKVYRESFQNTFISNEQRANAEDINGNIPTSTEAPANPKQAPDVTQASGAVDYEHMSHADLLTARRKLAPDDPKQVELAKYEHQAFAREWVKENPVLATASLTAAIPAYSAAKAIGAVKSRTPASFNEVAAAYKGIGQGLGLVD